MPLMPKRVKHRKFQRGKIKGKAHRGNRVSFGEYGLQSLERAWITAEQIEAGRLAVMHYLKREGKLTIRIFPHKSVTKKPAETRQGKSAEDDFDVGEWLGSVGALPVVDPDEKADPLDSTDTKPQPAGKTAEDAAEGSDEEYVQDVTEKERERRRRQDEIVGVSKATQARRTAETSRDAAAEALRKFFKGNT